LAINLGDKVTKPVKRENSNTSGATGITGVTASTAPSNATAIKTQAFYQTQQKNGQKGGFFQ
jgi:hypothetical protein